MKLNLKRLVIFLVLIVLAIGFIFYNSLQNSEESHKASGIIENIVKPLIDKIFGEESVDINYVVRKAAHLTEFCILGFVVMGVVLTVVGKYFGYGLFCVLAIAVTDEYIQSFSDRTSSVKDVLIDFTGALIGFVICTVLYLIAHTIKKKYKSKQIILGKHFKQ